MTFYYLFCLAVFVFTFWSFKVDFFLGLFIFFLSLYIVMPITGYIFFPELSELMNAHFGYNILDELYLFVLLSYLMTILVFSFWKRNHKMLRITIFELRSLKDVKILGFLTILFFQLFLVIYFMYRFNDLNYTNINNDYFKNDNSFAFFMFIYKFSPGILIVLYDFYLRKLMRPIFLFYLILFICITLKIGFKTDLVALVVGLTIYNFYKRREFLFTTKMLGYLVIFISLFGIAEYFRYQSFEREVLKPSLLLSLIDKDYFPPAHLLFASIHLDYIIPFQVIKSNVLNLIPGINFPYLQYFITEEFNPGITSRSNSYAYYVLTEGYNFIGFFGFFYNGILGFLLATYRFTFRLGKSNLDIIILSILGMNLVNLVRGQTVYFFKYLIIMDSIPFILLLLLNNYILIINFKKS